MQSISEMVGTRIHLLDSALWTAKEVQDILMALSGFSDQKSGGLEASRFLVTDHTPRFEELASRFLGTDLPGIEQVSLEKLTKLCVPSVTA
jgi:glutamate racemase